MYYVTISRYKKKYTIEDFNNLPEDFHTELINGTLFRKAMPNRMHQQFAGELNEHGCLGAPDWIIEIVSPSDAMHDYIDKLYLYHKAGVREYWIIDPQNTAVHVYSLEPVRFNVRTYTFRDTVRAGIYDDLFIDFANLNPSDIKQ